jgi:hypothetical protein
MRQHVNLFGAMVKKLDVIKFGLSNEMKVMVLLVSLLDNYQHLIIALESLKLKD